MHPCRWEDTNLHCTIPLPLTQPQVQDLFGNPGFLVFVMDIPLVMLTHWGRVTHICVGKLTIIGSDNGLSPARRQAIIWTNAGILLIGPWGTNFSEILRKIHTFSFNKMHLTMSSGKWRPFCLGLNVLNYACPLCIFHGYRRTIAKQFSWYCVIKTLFATAWIVIAIMWTVLVSNDIKHQLNVE